MPWQQQVADVIGEVDEDTGRLAYREVVLTVPRQSGKTSLMLPVLVYRCLGGLGQRQRVVYTAQTRSKAKEKWELEHVDMLHRSVFEGMFDVRLAAGSERLHWRDSGSTHSIDAVTETAGHGGTIDLAVIDEAFAQSDWRTEQAMKPAMITRPQPQLLITSTAGTAKSVYLRSKVDAGRLRCDGTPPIVTKGAAYFEWSAADGSDPDDPAVWWSCMPALGHTINEDAVAADRESMRGQPGEFERAYLNLWPEQRAVVQAIGADVWEACRNASAEPAGRMVWGVDVSPDRATTAIGGAAYTDLGAEYIELIDYREGTRWVLPRLQDLRSKHGRSDDVVAVDASGPAGSLIPDLEEAGFTVKRLSQRDKAAACGSMYDAAVAGVLVHRGQGELDTALSAAEKHAVGDVWMWSRGASLLDITPLWAVTAARWALLVTEDPWYDVSKSFQ